MYTETITVDVDALRKDMKSDSLGAFFGGGFGGALFEAGEIDRASPEKLVALAREKGIDLRKYRV